jgi:mxaA protein
MGEGSASAPGPRVTVMSPSVRQPGAANGALALGTAATALLWLLFACVPVGATVLEMRVDNPRDFGWFIGDRITRRVTIEVEAGFDLDRDALPEPGELNHWLELADVDVRSRGQQHVVTLVYRLTNLATEGGARVLPGFDLYTAAQSRRVPTNVPEWGFTQGIVMPPATVEVLRVDDVRPDRPPPPVRWSAHFVRTVMLGLAVLVLALYLFYCHFGAVWLARWRRPFTAALRDMRRQLEGRDWDPRLEALGLERFHAAVNEAAGRVVLNDDLDDFLRRCPVYAPEGEQIAQLFARSRAVFFAGSGNADETLSRDWLLGLCRRLSVLELSTP